jgi:hypothetical protein
VRAFRADPASSRHPALKRCFAGAGGHGLGAERFRAGLRGLVYRVVDAKRVGPDKLSLAGAREHEAVVSTSMVKIASGSRLVARTAQSILVKDGRLPRPPIRTPAGRSAAASGGRASRLRDQVAAGSIDTSPMHASAAIRRLIVSAWPLSFCRRRSRAPRMGRASRSASSRQLGVDETSCGGRGAKLRR